jgi:hypothetical protein
LLGKVRVQRDGGRLSLLFFSFVRDSGLKMGTSTWNCKCCFSRTRARSNLATGQEIKLSSALVPYDPLINWHEIFRPATHDNDRPAPRKSLAQIEYICNPLQITPHGTIFFKVKFIAGL